MRILELDLVDDVDAEVHMHGFIAHDVLELLGNPRHFVATTHRQDLHKTDIEEDALEHHIERHQIAQQTLVGLHGPRVEGRIAQALGEPEGPRRLVVHRRDLAVHVENLCLVEPQRFDAVLVCMRMKRLFEGLTQQVLAAFRVGDVAVNGEHQIVGNQRVCSREEAQIALDNQTLVFGQTVRALPQRDVGGHVDFLRHPVVGACVQILLPCPAVLERHQLVEVGAAVDHGLVVDGQTRGAKLNFFQTRGDGAAVIIFIFGLCRLADRSGIRGGRHDHARHRGHGLRRVDRGSGCLHGNSRRRVWGGVCHHRVDGNRCPGDLGRCKGLLASKAVGCRRVCKLFGRIFGQVYLGDVGF